MAAEFPDIIVGVDGWSHMTALRFEDLARAKSFTASLNQRGLDISAQTYKPDCPPVVLTKLPLIADRALIDFVIDAMRNTLSES